MGTKNPKDFNLTEVLKQYVKDQDKVDEIVEAIDVDGIKRSIDEDYTQPIVNYRTQQTRDKAKDELKGEIMEDVVKDLGIEDVENQDQLKSWAKRLQSTTSEKDETVNRLQKELETVKPEYEKYKSEVDRYKTLRVIDEKGFDPNYSEDVYTLAKSRVTEETTLEDVLDNMKETHSQFLAKPSAGSTLNPNDGDPDPEELAEKEQKEWEEKYGVDDL